MCILYCFSKKERSGEKSLLSKFLFVSSRYLDRLPRYDGFPGIINGIRWSTDTFPSLHVIQGNRVCLSKVSEKNGKRLKNYATIRKLEILSRWMNKEAFEGWAVFEITLIQNFLNLVFRWMKNCYPRSLHIFFSNETKSTISTLIHVIVIDIHRDRRFA